MDSAFCGDDEGEGVCMIYESGDVTENGGGDGGMV